MQNYSVINLSASIIERLHTDTNEIEQEINNR